MDAFRKWFMNLVNRWVEWIFRKRNVGLAITAACCSVLAVIVSANISVEASGILGVVGTFKFSTGEGTPGFVQTAIAWVMLAGAIVGIVLTVHSYRKESKEADIKRVVVVELRGSIQGKDSGQASLSENEDLAPCLRVPVYGSTPWADQCPSLPQYLPGSFRQRISR
jgi:hypothetical protein